MSFVGVRQLSTADELKELLTQQADLHSYYFLRWFHKVSGIVKDLPSDFPSPEGQMFSENYELRWKQNKKGYEVLLLSETDADSRFTPVGKTWKTRLRPAQVYSDDETRFPNKFRNECHNLAQRYFIDQQTGTVQFIALTINLKKS
ncbi:hypothetical protein C7H19_10705 [Aphanothece hegewaldii CCALA 016]|uniref:Uncharacterized protein n=1 Tax=Aphanothece hegewaldii CCALA 016 TaxID=2107694 RepID=A0A2T1LYC1_9CHRO|nr:hypothetical protein [Aphanothece hegewaldii]PSF37388.1 hypothetical protein C7H19_10705 [Aphanothece hegewaldii CCALA 016]